MYMRLSSLIFHIWHTFKSNRPRYCPVFSSAVCSISNKPVSLCGVNKVTLTPDSVLVVGVCMCSSRPCNSDVFDGTKTCFLCFGGGVLNITMPPLNGTYGPTVDK
uniref:ORF26 n=1 Tax=Malaco herpesvirus 4 TaxID=3031800 RepID=A0AA48P7N3_9VIRU|nr:TPA_asm: ORF26 [Malaco herpesvirus 4]